MRHYHTARKIILGYNDGSTRDHFDSLKHDIAYIHVKDRRVLVR